VPIFNGGWSSHSVLKSFSSSNTCLIWPFPQGPAQMTLSRTPQKCLCCVNVPTTSITDSFFPVLQHILATAWFYTILHPPLCSLLQHSENWHLWWSSLFCSWMPDCYIDNKIWSLSAISIFSCQPLFLADGWWSKQQDFSRVGPVSYCTIECFLWVLCYFKFLKSKSDSMPLNYISLVIWI
jgi:hypothetical protein